MGLQHQVELHPILVIYASKPMQQSQTMVYNGSPLPFKKGFRVVTLQCGPSSALFRCRLSMDTPQTWAEYFKSLLNLLGEENNSETVGRLFRMAWKGYIESLM